MNTIFTSPKGGNCTTVTAAAHALLAATEKGNTLLIDFGGDLPATLGLPEPTGPGINDWLAEDREADGEALVMLGTAVTSTLLLVHRGSQFIVGQPRWDALARAMRALTAHVVIDAGAGFLPGELRAAADRVLMVTRPCYLSLRRATSLPKPTGVCVVCEADRALTTTDVAHVLGVPVAAQVPHSAAVARAVDAGLLPSRVHQLFGASLAFD